MKKNPNPPTQSEHQTCKVTGRVRAAPSKQ